jgi:transcriptional regulator with XRE-family HTH domain
MSDILQKLINEKKEKEGISWREASRQAGIAVTTMIRIAEDGKPDPATLERICAWLNVKPGFVLGTNTEGLEALSNKLVGVLKDNPALADALERVIDRLDTHQAEPEELASILRFIDYQLNDQNTGQVAEADENQKEKNNQ